MSVKRAVILPIEKSDMIEVHLAWEIVAGKSLSWTVYIDAINGEELKVIQNSKHEQGRRRGKMRIDL